MQFFVKTYKRSKKIAVPQGLKQKRGQVAQPTEFSPLAADADDLEEHILEEGNLLDPKDDALADTLAGDLEEAEMNQATNDIGQAAHDDKVAKTIRETAQREMAMLGVIISPDEEQAALKVIPKVSFLALYHEL
jgi:hypothetical protein